MSTQGIQVSQTWTGNSGTRRVAAVALVLAALAVGAVLGRSTAPTARVREAVRPVTALTDLGQRSVGDLRRAQYHRAMGQTTLLTTGEPSIGDSRRAEMFKAMNRLSENAFNEGADGWARYAQEHTAANETLPQQI